MSRPPDRKHLLADVLAETTSDDFRSALLGETLRRVRRRRLLQRVRQTTAVAILLIAFVASIWRVVPRTRANLEPVATARFETVRTRSLPGDAIVITEPLGREFLVASSASVTPVHTTKSSAVFRAVDDAELLALVAPRPAILIRVGPHSQELVFANPEDRNGFPMK